VSAPSHKKKKTVHGLVARQFATSWLFEIVHHQALLDDVFARAEQEPKWRALEVRDRAFARAILLAALRRKGDLTWVLNHFLQKPLQVKTQVQEILTIGAAQLLLLNVAPHAVIDMAVRQAKQSDKSRHLAKLVNAVLRRVSEQGHDLLAKPCQTNRNVPSFLYQRWQKHYGDETAGLIASSVLKPAALDIITKDDPENLVDPLSAKRLPGNCLRLAPKGAVNELPGFAEGAWWVQDFAAFLPTQLFGPLDKAHVLDLCAAPGGKTCALITQGAEVTAVDVSKERLVRLQENLQRLSLSAEVVVGDVLDFKPEQPFDCVLLDAPCSATGTIRRHPDILHRGNEKIIGSLAKLQRKMLERSIEFVKPGGQLIYCTCSLEPEEGEQQIERFLQDSPQVERMPFKDKEIYDQNQWLTDKGDIRLLPFYAPPSSDELTDDLSGMDGFFISRLTVK